MISVFKENIDNRSIVAVFDTSGIEQSMFSGIFLNEEEKKEFSLITNEKRKTEWLSSRKLVALVCAELGIAYKGTRKDEIGRLWLMDSQYHVSISHCTGYCAVIVSLNGFCGIDIEPIDPRILRISKKFMSEREQKLASNDLFTSTLFWSAKEAMYKVAGKNGIIFATDLYLNYTDGNLEGAILNHNLSISFRLYHKKLDNLVLVWLLEK